MGLILNKNFSDSCRLGIWLINEDYDSLLSHLTLNTEELTILNGFRNYNRKLEWLSVRTLVNAMTGKNIRIVYNDERKPSLEDNSCNISISHSHNLTSILMSRNKKVGIDLEYMSHRISNIADRFIHESEKVSEDPALARYHLYIHWCAKEALYKICDKQGIHFKKDIIIDRFEPEAEGKLSGIVKSDAGIEKFNLNYFRINDYIIVWSCK